MSKSSFPPLAAIYLTHFDDTKGQSVLYYKSVDEAALPVGTIEHSSLPSGLHATEEDLFGFRHGNLPAVGLFRSRTLPEGQGRGRRMATLGVVLADGSAIDELFSLKKALGGVYDRIESLDPSGFTSEGSEGRASLTGLLDEVWATTIHRPEPSSGARGGGVERLRRLVDPTTSLTSISDDHPIHHLPRLLEMLGPQITTVYKAALTGQRILIYSQPPFLPLSAYAYCIAAMSLPPRALPRAKTSEWMGQVGLMDLDGLYARKGSWVAATSEKILLSHTELFDLSIDLSNPTPEIRRSVAPQQLVTYSFADIPLYRSLQALALGAQAGGEDWWMTLYDLMDRVWSLCTGVCEYAIGRGRLGAGAGVIALSGDEDASGDDTAGLLGEEAQEQEQEMSAGQLILRQLYHNTHHLYARLRQVRPHHEGEITFGEVRGLTGRWIISQDDVRFWSALARRWRPADVDVDVDDT